MFSSFLCQGTINHSRFAPKQHGFSYQSSVPLLDLDDIHLLNRLPLVSVGKVNLITFNESDYLKEYLLDGETIKQRAVRVAAMQDPENAYLLHSKLSQERVKVLLLAHWRFLGRVFNPIAIFYIFIDEKLEYMVSEVNNTPWNQRHLYVKHLAQSGERENWECPKAFHVSPFHPMDLVYKWNAELNEQALMLVLSLCKNNQIVFSASMDYQLKQLSIKAWKKHLLRQPFASLQIVWGIYWQALKLFFKRIPFYQHPDSDPIKEKQGGSS